MHTSKGLYCARSMVPSSRRGDHARYITKGRAVHNPEISTVVEIIVTS